MNDSGADESYASEDLDTDTGSYSLDDEDQLQPEDTLIDRGVDDILDEGYSPPERPLGVDAFGTTAWEQSQDETIEERIKQEVSDPSSAYGAPDNESGLDEPEMLGGDDPDAIPAEDDFVGGSGRRSGRLVAPDEGTHEDVDKELVAEDVGFAGAAASAEEAAMHVVDDAYLEPDGVGDDPDRVGELGDDPAGDRR